MPGGSRPRNLGPVQGLWNGKPRVLGDPVAPDGPKSAGIMIVGEAPGEHEDHAGRGFVGPSGQLLWTVLGKLAHITRASCFVTNLVKVRPPNNRDPKQEEIDYWGPFLEAEIAEIKPRWIITMGKYSTYYLTGLDYPMHVVNGMCLPLKPGICKIDPNVIPIIHPAAALHDGDALVGVCRGVQAFADYLDEPLRSCHTFTYENPTVHVHRGTFPMLEETLAACDTEGSIREPYSIQVSVRDDEGHIIYVDDAVAVGAFKEWLLWRRPTLLFHYASHDVRILKACGIDLRAMGIEVRDTLEMAYLNQYKVGKQGSLSLKLLAPRVLNSHMEEYDEVVRPHWQAAANEWGKRRLQWLTETVTAGHDKVLERYAKPKKDGSPGRRLKDQLIKCECGNCEVRNDTARWCKKDDTDWSKAILKHPSLGLLEPLPEWHLRLVPEPERHRYMALDPCLTLRLAGRLMTGIYERGLGRAMEMDHSRHPQIERMVERGLLVDRERLYSLRNELTADAQTLSEAIQDEARDSGWTEEFNPDSGDQLASLLQRVGLYWNKLTKGGTRLSVDDDVLEELAGKHPIVDRVREYRSITKVLGTYVAFIDAETDWNGDRGRINRLHPDLNTTATFTGRLAGRLLTFPRPDTTIGKRLRSCFVAPPGWVIASWDLGQIEPRMLGHLSGDAAFRALCVDHIYERVTGFLRHKDWRQVTKQERQAFKTITLAVIYGMGDKSLAEDLKIELSEASALRREFLGQFPGVAAFQQSQQQFMRDNGFVRCLITGRIRYLPAASLLSERMDWPCNKLHEEAMRAGFNHLMQSGAQGVEIMLQARLDSHYQPDMPWFFPLLQIHDDIVAEMPEENWVVADAAIRCALEDVAAELKFTVPLAIDGKKGPSWGEMGA